MEANKRVDLNFFPGWTRKSISFTIDDGNLKLDRKFLGILKPYGFLGSFNLVSSSITPENRDEYIELYRGYEITNHCKYHPFAILEDDTREISDEPYSPETADPKFLYRSDVSGLYHEGSKKSYRLGARSDVYLALAEEGRRELEEIFGEGSVHAFVWPYGKQADPKIFKGLCESGYMYIRKTGDFDNKTGFAVCDDRMNFSYNAHNFNMLDIMEKYEAYPDDGELKMFTFGVHSHDFENAGNWDVLETFAEKYGNRPEDYYYASVYDIFSYEDAVKSVTVTDTEVINPTDIKLYIKIDGKRVTLFPRWTVKI